MQGPKMPLAQLLEIPQFSCVAVNFMKSTEISLTRIDLVKYLSY